MTTEIETATRTTSEPIDIDAIEAELRPLSSENLQLHFSECFRGSAMFFARAAVCVKLLRERGVEWKCGSGSALETYRLVADKQLDPEALAKFITSPNRAIIRKLPMTDQRRLAKDSMVPVVIFKPGGKHDVQKIDLVKAPRDVIKQVIGKEGVLDTEQQISNFCTLRPRRAVAARIASEPPKRPVTVYFSASEEASLTEAANRAGRSVADLIRDIVLGSGKLK